MPEALPLPKEKLLPMPAVGAALGMAISYYSYSFLINYKTGYYIILALIIALIAVINFFRVVILFPGEKNKAFYKVSILVIAAALGMVLGIASRRSVQDSPNFALETEKIIAISGILKNDPRTLSGGSGFANIRLFTSNASGGISVSSSGTVMVFFPSECIPRLKEFGRGAEIYMDGSLSQKNDSWLFSASSVHVLKPASALEQTRTSMRMKLLEKFQMRQDGKYSDSSAPVWGGLASALLFGMRDDLDVDLSQGFRDSGCAHILALSGMHLAILSGVLAFLLKRPLGLRGASLAGAVFVIVYVFIADSQPSLIRSAIMYFIGAFSLLGFLKRRPISLLCMAFIIQLVFQSETGQTLSFILSYLALAGILTLGETFRSLFRGRLPDIIGISLSASLGAFIFTAPVMVFYFSALRPIGIAAGLVIAPLSSLFMVLSLAALIISFLPSPLWSVIDFFLTQVYRLFELVVSLASRFPVLQISNPVPVLIFSILFLALILFIHRKDYAHRSSIVSFD